MKNRGFTLAEVLITLAIVGVVAALTIPSLINKCQKIVWAKQAQENYAILTQAFKRILADNNTTSLEQTEVWSKITGGGIDYCADPTTNDIEFWTEFGKYIKISSDYIDIKGEEDHITIYENDYDKIGFPYSYNIIYLSNGAQLFYFDLTKKAYRLTESTCTKIKTLGGNVCNRIVFFDMDVNGDKGPNTYGRDIFEFFISDEGILYPSGGKDYALYNVQTELASNPDYWKTYYNGTKEQNAKKSGYYRTGQLMEEGWKMNY
jgi:prepilin-type N-terminal cleavage/methylation domain-containing protein